MASSQASAEVEYYEKPGQRYPTPSPGAGDRVFYESLFKEKGEASDLAVVWCIEHGVFPLAVAKDMTKKYLKAKERLRSRTMTKPVTTTAPSKSRQRASGPTVVAEVAVSDATVGMSTAAGDGIGTAAL